MMKKDKENYLIESLGNSLCWIIMGIIGGKREEFEGHKEKILNFREFLFLEKEKGETHNDNGTYLLRVEAEGKRHWVYESCKELSFRQLLRLAEISRKHSTRDLNIRSYLELGYMIVGVWADRVLEEHYGFSIARRQEVFAQINDWVDSYQKGYLDNYGINEMYKEDYNVDLTQVAIFKSERKKNVKTHGA